MTGGPRSAAQRSRGGAALLALVVGASIACGVNEKPLAGKLWTLDQYVPAARAGTPLDPKRLVVLRGQPIELLSPPYAPAPPALQQAEFDGLAVLPSFSEGKPAAYTITERWSEFPKVWVQPLYLFVSGFDPSSGAPLFVANNNPVFGVNTTSRFYSPYWQIYYAVVPAGAADQNFQSEKDIFDAKLALVEGALTLCAIGPDEVNLARAQGDVPRRPITGEALNPPKPGVGWVDGLAVHFLDFGRNRIRANDHLVVEETALFRFALRDPATGADRALDLPTVGGTAPLGKAHPPEEVGNTPQFASHWHEYLVVLNPTNPATKQPGVFVPPSNTALRERVDEITGDPRWAPVPPASVETLPAATLAAFTLRVAANAQDCFNDPAFPAGVCSWLDSQRAIEGRVASALIHDTGNLSSCPILLFNGVATP